MKKNSNKPIVGAEERDLIRSKREDQFHSVLANLTSGFLITLMAFTLVSSSALEITGGTLYAVGQNKIDNIVSTYMGTESYQNKKAEQQKLIESFQDFTNELDEFNKNGYISNMQKDAVKSELAYNTEKVSEAKQAEKMIAQDENNEFYGMLKDSMSMRTAGIVLMSAGGFTLLTKALTSLMFFGDLNSEYLCTGDALTSKIGENVMDIVRNTKWIIYDNKEIKKLKKQIKELEAAEKETTEEENAAE